MADINRYLDYSGTDELWKRIVRLCDKKIESVTNFDDSIVVSDKRRIKVKISESEDNQLKLKQGLYVPKNHTLSFGPYKYDGTEDISVTIYDGEYQI